MEESAFSGIKKASILVSRNRPVALIVNACTFLGSHLANSLLEKGIQVIGIDDLSISERTHLSKVSKEKDFHFINFSIDSERILDEIQKVNLSRLDYSFFITDSGLPQTILSKGIVNFINLIEQYRKNYQKEENLKELKDKPRLVFVSSINLYGKNLSKEEKILKEAEARFANGIRHFKFNGRVIRLADIFGPGMNLEASDPLTGLITASLLNKLNDEKISLDFSERSLYVDDAVNLLIKSVFSGSTSNKIYDGALLHPIRLSEIKQILVNPIWAEENPPTLSKLPAWPSPNLLKTIKELAWAPKTPVMHALRNTIAYFKENQEFIPKIENERPNYSTAVNWSFSGTGFLKEDKEEKSEAEHISKVKNSKESFDKQFKREARNSKTGKFKRTIGGLFIAAIIIFGLIWPMAYLTYQGFNIKNELLAARNYLEKGNFAQSEQEISKAKRGIGKFQEILGNARILKKIPGIKDPVIKAERILNLAQEGVEGVGFATEGSKALFETTKIISGESRDDPRSYYSEADKKLKFASNKLAKVYASLGDEELKEDLPSFIANRIDDLKSRLGFYLSLVEQTQSASELMPKITGLEGKKSYLVLLQNNLELRPTGGFIGSYAKLDFENGRLAKIDVDDIYNLDGALKEVIPPPQELKQDLGIDRLFLRDSNYEPDFPTNARQASFFYKRETGDVVHGVIAMDLKASGNLLDAVGGLDLPEYGESVNGANLFEKAISHAETNFFPGSQAKKNYLTSLQTQLFNKIFYLSKQNWPAIIQAVSKSLKEKHILVYLEDPALFSYLASSNWSGVFPRASETREGETNDFLAVIESNMGANKSNYFLQRKHLLANSFTKEGKIQHQLKINYKNTSPSDIFPAGKYKNRIKVYVPLGAKLTKALFGETEITDRFTSFSDYGRSGFSSLIEIMPKEQKTLIIEYELADSLNFKDNLVQYKMEIFKQPGIIADPLDFSLTYPINFKIEAKPDQGNSGVQEIKIVTDMQTDRVFQFKVRK